MIIVLVYMDDILFTGDDQDHRKDTKTNLRKTFKMKDLYELKYFLGIEFSRSKEGIVMHQKSMFLN